MQQNRKPQKNGLRAAHRLAGLCAGALCILSLCLVLPVRGEQSVYRDVVRLHVLAASDSAKDQALKLAVRDYILQHCQKELLTDEDTAAGALQTLQKNRGKIEAKLAEYLREQGAEYGCTVLVQKQYFSRRWYGMMCFPAGEYEALVVTLGSGQGRNWWCVLYPPLCLRAAGGASTEAGEEIRVSAQNRRALEQAGISRGASDMLSDGTRPHIRIKLRFVEMLAALFGGE